MDEREKISGRSPSTGINQSMKEFIRHGIIVESKVWGKHTGLKHDGAKMIEFRWWRGQWGKLRIGCNPPDIGGRTWFKSVEKT